MGRGIDRGMRRGLVSIALALALAAATPTTAHATDLWCWLFRSGCHGGGTTQQTSPERSGAPEIDPGALANAIALAAGGVALIGDRVRRRRR